MDSNFLQKTSLPPDWIDCAIGEAQIVRNNLIETFDCDILSVKTYVNDYFYPAPNGFKPLVDFLEEKHSAPVIITNGCKQALGAVFYCLHKLGYKTYSMRTPYWALIPPLGDIHDMTFVDMSQEYDSFLYVGPNNPDGHILEANVLLSLDREGRSIMPIIHDAAYFSHIYLPHSYPLQEIGNVATYSASKSIGISGTRIGYMVCRDKRFYSLAMEYMEAMTVGVSINSQSLYLNILKEMKRFPNKTERFENKSALQLFENKREFNKLTNYKALNLKWGFEEQYGMFLFAETSDISLFEKAKVKVADGKYFGAPGYVRLNMGLPQEQIKEVVRRLNSL